MYCKNCGRQLDDNMNFCVYCGCNLSENAGKNRNVYCYSSETSGNAGNEYDNAYSNADKDVQIKKQDKDISLFGHKIKSSIIMKTAAVIAIICFFCPMFMVSCSGVKLMDTSMVELTFGYDTGDYDSYGSSYSNSYSSNSSDSVRALGMAVFFFSPITALVTCMLSKKRDGWGQEAAIIFGSSAVSLLIVYSDISNNLSEAASAITITPLLSFYIYIIVNIIGAIVGMKVAEVHNRYIGAKYKTGIKGLKYNALLMTIAGSLIEGIGIYIIYSILNSI